MDAKIFRVNYKSDFILTLISDAGWMTPFCIKFWTGAPSQAYYAQYDGTTYTNCAPVAGEPTKLTVQFDDHHMPIGNLKYQVAYHFTVADFPNDTEDEVLNQANITTEIDGETYQVMLDFTGETAPEIQFSLPAYANEAQRIANELQREANELQREANEEDREDNELNRQRNEGTRIENERERVQEFQQMKGELEQATRDAAAATENANGKAVYAKNQGDYAKQQGDYAKEQGDIAKADHLRAEEDHRVAGEDHTQAGNDHTRAGEDHTQAGNDHTRAGEDHTQAGNDHTRAGEDHTRAESDHAAVEVYVDSLGVFDLSKHNAVGGVLATYADLNAALTALNALESKYKYGGMSLKYVQSSDNKYVQFRYMGTEVTGTPNPFLDTANWQGVDDVPTKRSKNLVTSDGVYSELNPYRQIAFTPISKKGSGQYRSLTSASIVDTYAIGFTADYYEVQAGNTYKISGISSRNNGSLMMVYFATALNYNTPTISIKTFTQGEFSVEYTPESDGYIFVQITESGNTVLTSVLVQLRGYGELINFKEDYDAKIGNLSSLDDFLTKTSIVNSINSLFNIYKPYLAYQYSPVPKKGTKSINCSNNGGTGTIDIYAANCSADCYEIQTGKKYKVSCVGSAGNGGLMMIYTAVNTNYGTSATCIATFLEGSVVREFTSDINGYVIVQVRRGDSYTTTNISVEVSEQIAEVVDFQEQIDEIGSSIETINETISKDEKILAYIPKIVNRIPNFEREEFRILMIGNSFDGDYTSILRYMCSSAGIDISKICIYFMMRSAGTFKMWYDIYNDQADSTYTIYKPLGELSTQSQNCIYAVDSNNDSVDDRIGVAVQGTNGGLFRDILSKNRWDIVFIHQDTRVATSYDWEGHDDKGYLNELVRIVRTSCPKACVGTIINHAGYNNAVSAGQTTEERFNLIANAVKMFQKDYGLDMIVPCGTAVENIRKSILNTTTMGFSYDGHHLGIGIGQYAANAALFESIIAPRYGISVLGNSLRVSVVPGQAGYENGESLPVTDDNASTVQMAAILAVNNMYKVQNPDGVIL